MTHTTRVKNYNSQVKSLLSVFYQLMIKLIHLVYVVLVTWISDTKWKDESKRGWNTDVTSKMDPE